MIQSTKGMNAATPSGRTGRARPLGELWRASALTSRSACPASRQSFALHVTSVDGWLFCQLLVCLFALALPLGATDPGTAIQAAVVAKEGVPGLVRAGKGIVEVPWQAAQCLRLPLGLVEMVLSPLPGVEFSDGLANTGRGLVAPFKLCIATLEMPYEVFGGIGDAVTGVM